MEITADHTENAEDTDRHLMFSPLRVLRVVRALRGHHSKI